MSPQALPLGRTHCIGCGREFTREEREKHRDACNRDCAAAAATAALNRGRKRAERRLAELRPLRERAEVEA